MGQYYIIVNLDKKQFIHPHKFGDGLKLLEFGCSSEGTLTALAILLADGNGRGGGDLKSENPIVGSWAGDRIVIAGDYADGLKFLEDIPDKEIAKLAKKLGVQKKQINLYVYASEVFGDVSEKVIEAMNDDPYLREALKERKETFMPDLVLNPN